MKKIIVFCIGITLLMSCNSEMKKIEKNSMKLNYPETKKGETVDNYHGKDVKDEYRWLETDTADDVKKWVGEQNKVTQSYLSQIPYRDKIKERYAELFNYVKLSSPFKVGEYYFFSKNDGLQNQAVIYYQKGLNGEPSVFIDPNQLSKEGTASIGLIGFSKDDKYVAYSRQDAGSDWQEIHVMEIATKKKMPDVLKWVKFSGANWSNGGFYYSRYPKPDGRSGLSAANEYHTVYYHKLGTEQSEDKVVYSDPKNPKLYHFTGITEDKKFLVLYVSTGTDGFETHYKDLTKPNSNFVKLFSGFKNKSNIIDHKDGKFLVITDIDAPKYKLISEYK